MEEQNSKDKSPLASNSGVSSSSLMENFIDKLDKSGCKITFGLTDKNIEVIEKHIAKYGKYNYYAWKDIGKEIHWDALTAALYYFEKLDNERK